MKAKLTILLSLCATVCWAQQVLDSRVRRISVVDGLKSNNVYCIRQDMKGFVWFGTENGLSRYDGYRFVSFTQLGPDSSENTDKRVGQILFSKDGKILKAITASRDTAIYSLVENRFLTYRRFRKKSPKFTNRSLVDIINGYQFISDKKGYLTIVSPKGDKRQFCLINHLVIQRNKSIFVTSDGKGKFYIATYGAGLYVYDPVSHSMEHFTASQAHPLISSNFLTDVMVDSQGNVWVGCEELGACCIRPSYSMDAWYVFPEPGSRDILANNIRCIYPLDNDQFLVGAKSGRNYYYDVNTNRFTFAFDQGNGIYSYLKAKDGTTQIGTQSQRIFDILQDAQGRIWKAIFEGGVSVEWKSANGKLQTKKFLTENYNMSCVRDLELGKDGKMWISTNAGLYLVDTKGRNLSKASFHHVELSGVMTDNEVDFVHISPKGNVWIGVLGKGLVKVSYHNNQLKLLQIIDSDKGLPVNNVRSVRELPSGDLWLALEEGLCYVGAHGDVVAPYSFSSNAESNVFSENTSALCKNGEILFGSRNGMLVIKKGVVPQTNASAPVLITDLMVNGTSRFLSGGHLDGNVELKHGVNSIVFNYTDFNYGRLASRLYEYYLEGVDNGWREPTGMNSASYANLAPGKYVFHIKKQGTPDCQATTMTIIILQPWYNTWWAWLIYLIIISVIGVIFFKNGRERFRLKQQIKMDRQLMDFRINFFTHVAHEFRTPIAIIQNAVNKIKEDRNHCASRNVLSSAVRGTNRLSLLINQLMDFRRINTGNLHLHVSSGNVVSFVQRICQDYWDMAKQKNLNFVFTPFAKEFTMLFDPKVLETILYNLVSNAIKYTPSSGSISIKMGLGSSDILIISVENAGPAISEKQLSHLFEPFMHGYVSQGGMGIGLYMAHSMAKLHHGELEYVRKEDSNCFVVSLPVNIEAYSEEERSTQSTISHEEPVSSVNVEEMVRETLPNPLNSYHVAIIEDDFDMLEQVKGEVGQFFHVDAYSDGISGVEGVKKTKPALILCDVMMPGIDGYEVVKRIRADEELRNTPVIMITSMDDDTHQMKAYEVGADDYVIKPCSYKVLMTRIAQFIKWKYKKESEMAQMETTSELHTESKAGKSKLEESKPDEPKLLLSIEDKRFIEQVDAIIASRLSDPDFSLLVIAEMVSVGRTTLFGRIKKITGMPPNKYILKKRMELALQLLKESNLNISEIGCKVGIDDSAYFYRVFKGYYGMSPSQYRKQAADSVE